MRKDLAVTEASLGEAAMRIDVLVASLGAGDEPRSQVEQGLGTSPIVSRLQSAWGSFDSTWPLRREALCESLAGLAGVLRQMDESFADAEASLTRSLTSQPTAGASSRQVK